MTVVLHEQYLRAAVAYAEAAARSLPTLRAIVAIGSLARPGEIYAGWSDIDLLLVLDTIDARSLRIIAQLREDEIDVTGIAATVAPLSGEIVEQRFDRCYGANSVILNALSGRRHTARMLYGDIAMVAPPAAAERSNAICYVDETLLQLRRLAVSRRVTAAEYERDHKRAIRWAASILRAALRTRGIYALPYEPSVTDAMPIEHTTDWRRISEIFATRRSWHPLHVQEHSEAIAEIAVHAERIAQIVQ
jgi:predicted nucleotidyltransferase